jgi:hypothetical protein
MSLRWDYCTVMAWRDWGNTLKHDRNIDYMPAFQLHIASSHVLRQSALKKGLVLFFCSRHVTISSFRQQSYGNPTRGTLHFSHASEVNEHSSKARQCAALCNSTKVSKLVWGSTLLPCIREIQGWNIGHGTEYPSQSFLVFLSPFRLLILCHQRFVSHTLSNSLIIYHRTVRHYTLRHRQRR